MFLTRLLPVLTLCVSAISVVCAGYTFHEAPGYQMPQLQQTLARTLQTSPSLPYTFSGAYVEQIPVTRHPLSAYQLQTLFRSTPIGQRSLINLGPIHDGEQGTAFAMPVSHDWVRDRQGEQTFAILSASKESGDVHFWIHGYAKARNVHGFEGALKASRGWSGVLDRGHVMTLHELYTLLH